MNLSRIAGVVLTLAVTVPAHACLNDRDTLADEASGLLEDVIAAISGRFPRNPKLFYEMRIRRVTQELQADPSHLDLYDDIAVAYDRIGQDDDALRWIERKRLRLQPLQTTGNDAAGREDWYRYFANAGTFATVASTVSSPATGERR